MYDNGQIVTLRLDKSHGDNPEHALHLRAGVCGMILERHGTTGSGYRYVVDFGPEGQWNCVHSELDGTDREEPVQEVEEVSRPALIMPLPRSVASPATSLEVLDTDTMPKVFDPEADMLKRMKELEKGIKY